MYPQTIKKILAILRGNKMRKIRQKSQKKVKKKRKLKLNQFVFKKTKRY